MIPYILILFSILSFVFLAIGLIGKISLHSQDSRTYSVFILMSGVLFLILGFVILINGLEYVTGSDITESYDYVCSDCLNSLSRNNLTYFNYNTTGSVIVAGIQKTETLKYAPQKDFYTYSLGLIFLLLSLFLILTSIYDIAIKKENNGEQ